MDAALTLDDVYLTLPAASGPVEILKGVTFRAMPGESVAVIGPSGSGKSSLIAVATGIERATKGEVTLLGESLTGKSEDGLARVRRGRVSLVFQSFHLLGTMTAFDNVRAPLEIAGLSNVDALAKSGLEAVGLGARMDHFPGQLSGGERQRVAVARALASNPAIASRSMLAGDAMSVEYAWYVSLKPIAAMNTARPATSAKSSAAVSRRGARTSMSATRPIQIMGA